MASKASNHLHYDCPGHGEWGMGRTATLVPETVELFVCPSACGRHGALSAFDKGWKNKIYYLFLEPQDIISGYANLIPNAVQEVLDFVPQRPKAMYIFLTCIDDLIGTDRESLIETLSQRFPDIAFVHSHMDPIASDSKLPPAINIQNNMFGFLYHPIIGERDLSRDLGVNLIGKVDTIPVENDLRKFLNNLGLGPLRHISDFDTFEDYLSMRNSIFNIVTSAPCRQAAENLKRELGIDNIFLPISYRLTTIQNNYLQLEKKIGEIYERKHNSFDFKPFIDKAMSKIKEARELVKDYPIIVCAGATACPFDMALALIEYGFNVVRIENSIYESTDIEAKEKILSDYPNIEICYVEKYDTIRMDRVLTDSLSIGVEGAYVAKSNHVADLFNDTGMFGYEGLCTLMDLIMDGFTTQANVQELIENYGLVV